MPPTSPARTLLLGTYTAATDSYTGVTATGPSLPVKVTPQSFLTFYLTSIGTTSGGTIILEEADWNDEQGSPYSGTWSQLASVAASSFTGGAQAAFHFGPSSFGYVRARVSVAISGGGSIWIALRSF